MAKRKKKKSNGALAVNRKARHDYFIKNKLEAGLVLHGVEIKSIRARKVNLRDSYVSINNGEAWVRNMHVARYEQASTHEKEVDPMRPRKLLLNKREIRKLEAEITQKGMTIVPLRLYLSKNRAKLEIGVAQGKKTYDKRATIRKDESRRKIERALRGRY